MHRLRLVALVPLLGLGCSDPEPPTPRAAAQFRTFLRTGATSCRTGWGGIGTQEPYVEGDPTGVPEMPRPRGYPTNKGGPVYDAYEDNDITCKVSGDGSYQISAKLQGPNVSPSVGERWSGTSNNLTVDASIGADGKGTGYASFYTTEIFDVTPAQGVDCTFEIVPANSGDLSISPGKAWLTFNCPQVVMASMVSGCSSEGTVVLENCRE